MIRQDKVTVGTTAVQLVGGVIPIADSVLVRAPGPDDDTPNTGIVYVGGANVTTDNGMPLPPGRSISIPANRIDEVFVVSNSEDQLVNWISI